MIFHNHYIFDEKKITKIQYTPSHLFYLWSNYIQTNFSNIRCINNNINEYIDFLFVTKNDIKNPEFYNALSKFGKEKKQPKPLISIGYYDLKNVKTYLPSGFLDSSIWNYYIAFENENKENKKLPIEKLKKVIDIICNNYSNHLYEANVSIEYIKHNYNMLSISELPKTKSSSHAKEISPFKFHSEYKMKKEAKKIYNEINQIINNHTVELDILLVDDYANKELSGIKSSFKICDVTISTEIRKRCSKLPLQKVINKEEKYTQIRIPNTFTKKYILENLIEKFGFGNLKIKIQSTNNSNVIDDAILQMEGKTFDIILLDYLLGENKKTGTREKGEEFIVRLNPASENNKKKEQEKLKKHTLLGKHWILPVSSFNDAFSSKMTDEGIEKISNSIYIFEGADFINTPGLFLYHLLKLIQLQLNIAIVRKKDIINFILENLQGEDNANKQDNKDNLRTKARRLYGLFMHKFGMREALLADAENDSAFAKSVGEYLDNEGFEDQRFYEYARKLIFLIGYGTHYDAPRMWEIFTFIREEVNKLDLIEEKQKEIDKLFMRITNYLNKLTHE